MVEGRLNMMTPARFAELAEDVRREHGIDHELPSIAQMIDAIMEDNFPAEDDTNAWGEAMRANMFALPPDRQDAISWGGINYVTDMVLDEQTEHDPDLMLQGFGDLDILYQAAAKERFTAPMHPLAPLIHAWFTRPVVVEGDPADYGGGMLDSRFAVVRSTDRRARWPSLPFSFAAHFLGRKNVRGQMVLPGFERNGGRAVQLPLEILALAQNGEGDRRRGAALKIRLWLAGAFFAPPGLWKGGQCDVSARSVLNTVYPGKDGFPRGGRWQTLLSEARQALNEIALPYIDPETGHTGSFTPMFFHRMPDDADDSITGVPRLRASWREGPSHRPRPIPIRHVFTTGLLRPASADG